MIRTSISNVASRVVAMAVVLTAVSCATPNTGTTPTPGTLQISSISPGAPIAGVTPQLLTFNGMAFESNLSLIVNGPSGSTTLTGSAITNQSDTSFTVSMVLSVGAYQFIVENPGGAMSAQFVLLVSAATGGPQIVSISPASPSRNSQPQLLLMSGENFVNGLTVQVIDPKGALTIVTGPDISNITSTSFNLNITLSQTGTYSLTVMNPSGDVSNTVNIRVS